MPSVSSGSMKLTAQVGDRESLNMLRCQSKSSEPDDVPKSQLDCETDVLSHRIRMLPMSFLLFHSI